MVLTNLNQSANPISDKTWHEVNNFQLHSHILTLMNSSEVCDKRW